MEVKVCYMKYYGSGKMCGTNPGEGLGGTRHRALPAEGHPQLHPQVPRVHIRVQESRNMADLFTKTEKSSLTN